MRKFKSKDWHRVAGRGWIAVTRIPSEDKLPEIGSVVEIDGSMHKVRSVEYFMNMTSPPTRGEMVGIVVEYPPIFRSEDE